ncbi:hypothetical protein ILYODFUR_029994 [Ilyodon furcidens]|uniref:Uncharacterized protein n=1 Tax=Ilyodon furcidens TaxID=33524 RepID=A0ABV0UDS1_9TELE
MTLVELMEDDCDLSGGTSAAGDEETVDSRRLDDLDFVLPESQAGNIDSQTVRGRGPGYEDQTENTEETTRKSRNYRKSLVMFQCKLAS